MPTEAPFDPCRQWLGIDAVDLGNARLVLGVSSQEADPSVVLRAAEARLNLLRTISPGPFEMARAGLIKRVEEAREKLLADIAASPTPPSLMPPRPNAAVTFAMPAPPSQRANMAPAVPVVRQGAASAAPPVVPAAVPPVPPTVPGGGVETIAIRTTVYRKKTPVAGIALTVLALSGVAGGLVYYSAYGKLKGGQPHKPGASGAKQTALAEKSAVPGGSEPVMDRRSESRERPRKKTVKEQQDGPADPTSDRAVSTSKPPSPPRKERMRPEPEPEEEPMPEEEAEAAVPPPKPMRKPAGEMPARQKPDEMEVVAEKPVAEKPVAEKPVAEKPAEDAAAEAMAEEDSGLDATLAEALEALQRQEDDTFSRLLAVASKEARGREAKQRVAGWKLLGTYYKGFLEYREKALADVKPGDEYDVKNQKVGVVEVDAEKFVYRTAGGNKTVPRDKIPGGIVLAIVTQWFDSNPANDLYLGAYHLAKPEPDPKRAQEHWERALAAGADSSDLLPLLEDPVFARSE